MCVFGLSGGGKTTLMNIIGTIDTPTKGDMLLGGYRSSCSLHSFFISFLLILIIPGINANTPDNVLSFLRLKKMYLFFSPLFLIAPFS